MGQIFKNRWFNRIFFYLLGIVSLVLIIGLLSPFYVLNRNHSPIVVGQKAQRIVITNIKIIDLDNTQTLSEQYLLIENKLIKKISDTLPAIYENDLVINGQGLYLMAGLIDMHVHIYDRSDLLLNLAFGVTQVRNLHGMEMQLAFREEINSGSTIGPDLFVSSPIINQPSPYANSTFHRFVESPNLARELVNGYHQKGYDMIKIYDGIRPEIFQAIVDESNKLSMPFAGHPSFYVDVKDYLAAAPQSLEHVEMLYQASLDYSTDPEKLTQLSKILKQADVPVTATLVVFDNLVNVMGGKQDYIDQLPLDYMNPVIRMMAKPGMDSITKLDELEEWTTKINYLGEMTKFLYQQQIPILIGSDAGAGYTLNGLGTIDEIILLKKYGIDARDILTSATITAAKALNKNHEIGRVALGKKTNLIFTQQNPIKDPNTFYDLQGLIKDGVYYDEKAIAEMKLEAKNHMAYYEFLGWYLIDLWDRI